jgi:predicted permease
VVLLVAAGMLFDGFRKILVMNPGFRIDHILTMDFDTSLVPASPATKEFYRNLIDRTRALPGVKSATLSLVVPLAPAQSGQTVIPEGFQFPKGQESTQVFQNSIDEQYFDVMQTPIVRGRAFTANDKSDSTRVAIVNEEFANKYWPNQDAVGKKIRLEDTKGPVFQIVGIAKTAKYLFIAEPPMPFVYFPLTQRPQTRESLLVETYGDPAAITAPLRDVVRSLNPDQPIYNTHTLANFYELRGTAIFVFILRLVASMGLIGLTLALVGLYGLIAYSVSRRTQEIGIRMALGAQRSNVVAMVLRQGFLLAIIGIAIGFAASIAVRGILAQGLIGLGTLSPAVLAIVPLGLLLVTMVACYLPAHRAAQIDPLRALRWE